MGALRVTTTHLEYYSDVQRRGAGAAAAQPPRRGLASAACAEARHRPGARGPFDATPQTTRAILAGDFNFPPETSRPTSEIQHALRRPAARATRGRLANDSQPHPPTFCVHDAAHMRRRPYCCDFVFVSDDLRRNAFDRIEVDSETQASDHQPVLPRTGTIR